MHWLNRKKTFGEKKRDSGRICLAQIAIKKKEALGRPHPWALARFREEGWLGEEGCAGPAKKQAGPGACLGGQKEAHTWSGRSGAGLDLRQARPARASEAGERCGQRMWARHSSPSRQRRRHPRLLDRKKSSAAWDLQVGARADKGLRRR